MEKNTSNEFFGHDRLPPDALGTLATALALGVSIRHGIDTLSIKDTGTAIDAHMSRSEVFEQAVMAEPLQSGGELVTLEFMKERRNSYLEYLGMSHESIDRNADLIDRFYVSKQGSDGLEHILFGDTRVTNGLPALEGLHFLPVAKAMGMDITVLKDKSKNIKGDQKDKGIRELRISADGVIKSVSSTFLPETMREADGTERPTTIEDILHMVTYAYDHAQDEQPSKIDEDMRIRHYASAQGSRVPSMEILAADGKIMTIKLGRK